MASETANIIKDLIKGELNWHEKINNNFHYLDEKINNMEFPTTDVITKDSTDALTSGGMNKWLNPKSGVSFTLSEDACWIIGRKLNFQSNNIGQISMGLNNDEGINASATNGVKLIGGTNTYDSSATSGFRKCEASITSTGLTVSCTGKNTTIGDYGISFIHGWSHDSVNMPMFKPNAVAKIDLGSSFETWNTIYLANSPSVTSDRNQKKDISYMVADDADKIISKLKPCTYRFVDGTSGRIHNGLIAQDVEEALNDLGIDTKDFAAFIKSQKAEIDEDGIPNPVEGEYNYSLRYEEFISLLIAECQYLKSRIDNLESRLPVAK